MLNQRVHRLTHQVHPCRIFFQELAMVLNQLLAYLVKLVIVPVIPLIDVMQILSHREALELRSHQLDSPYHLHSYKQIHQQQKVFVQIELNNK